METLILVVAGLVIGSVILRLSLWVLKTIYAWAPFILIALIFATLIWYENGAPSWTQMKAKYNADHTQSIEH